MTEENYNKLDIISEELKKNPKSAIVIGAGISGLAIAWKLCKEGFKVVIIEKQKFAGGLTASLPYNGYKIELGPHIFLLPKKSPITEEIKEMMSVENLIEIHQPWAKSYYAGRFLDRSYPSLYDIVFRSGIKFFILGMFGLLLSKIRSNSKLNKYKSAEDYLIHTYGKFLYDVWFRPYFSKKCDRLDNKPPQFATKIFHPITKERVGSFLSKKISIKKSRAIQESFNCYPRFGMGSFIDTIINEINILNGNVILDAEIESICHHNELKSIIMQKNNKKIELTSSIIVYSTSLPVAIKWFKDVPNEVKLEVEKMKTMHSIMVFLFVDIDFLYKGWIITFYDNDLIIFRISQQNFLSSEIAPKGKTLLCVEIQTSEANSYWTSDEKIIVKRVINDLKKTGILYNEKIDGYKVIKIKNVYPIITSSDPKNNVVIDFINSFKNEYVINAMIDAGLVSSFGRIDIINDPAATGIYKAFINAEILVKEINFKLSLNK